MAEEVVIVKAPAKQAATLVTSENRAEFMAKKLDIAPAEPPKEAQKVEAKAEPKNEEKAKDDSAAGEEKDKTDAKGAKDEKKDKHALNERFSKLAEQRRQAEAEAKAEREKREAAERRAAEAEAKLAPPKAEPTGEQPPQRAQFTTDEDYIQALTDFKVEAALGARDKAAAEAKEKAAQTARITTFQERLAAAHKENPELQAKLDASTAVVSDQVRDAIIESEVGPKILEHFADHPEDAARIAKLTVGGALRELGKLEARFEAAAKPSTVTPEKEKNNVVEISRAPEPITPLKGNGAAPESPINSAGEFHGTYQQWKAARKAGKIT